MGLEQINKMRAAVGFSLDELSEKSGVPKGTLSKITAGITKSPSIETVKAIVYSMGFTLDDLDPDIKKASTPTSVGVDAKLNKIIEQYHSMNSDGQAELVRYTDYLSTKPEYKASDDDKGTVLVAARNGQRQRTKAIAPDVLDNLIKPPAKPRDI